MVNNIINIVRKQISKHTEILLLVGLVILLIITCLYFNNSNSNNNSNINNKQQNTLDTKKNSNINESFVNNMDLEKIIKNNHNNSKLNMISQIKKSLSVIDKHLFNIDSNIINNVNQKLIPSLNKNVNPNNFEFVNISGIESFSGLPFMKQNVNSPSLELNINDNMTPSMQLKRMKIVLQELKRRIEEGESIEISTKNSKEQNGNKNSRLVENFNDMKANEILKEIGNLLHDISKKTNISKHITQEEDNTYTVEEEIIIRNNKNQEDRKRDKDLAENIYIESIETEGIDTIYHPRIQII